MPSVSLTTAEKISFFQMVDIPRSLGYMTTDSMGSTVYNADLSSAIASQTKTVVEAYIDNAADETNKLDDAGRTALKEIITKYDACKYYTSMQSAGSVGSLSGMSFDWDSYRKNLKELAQKLVPVFKIMEAEARRMGLNSEASSTVRIIR